MYLDLKRKLEDIIEGEPNFITNAANFSALVYNSVSDINWVGFYLMSSDELHLGPFQGKPACMRIPYGKGVCGTSAKMRKTLLVEDVHSFPGHIACDPLSKSELVVPLIYNDKLFGVLDMDSPVLSRFTLEDKNEFEELVEVLVNNSDMEALRAYYKT
jgi:GAF domain-containing protein